VYMTHVLSTVSPRTASAEAVEIEQQGVACTEVEPISVFQCSLCPDRTFPNEEALYQHTRSRHSSLPGPSTDTSSLPSALLNSSPPSPSSLSLQQECPICGLQLKSTLEAHLREIIPSEPLSLQCLHCQKIFHTERSLQQHLRFCLSPVPPPLETL
jgi:hypothetical protein